jgi:hypothetical protein
MARRQALGWGQAPGWGLPVDDGPLRLRAAGSLGRWLWFTAAVVGFLGVVGYVLSHDDPQPGLSDRGWLTVALAAVLVVLLAVRRAAGPGPLARAMAEYAVVALLAVLLATASGAHQPAEHASNPSSTRDRPAVVQATVGVWDWLAALWHHASEQANPPPSTTTPKPTTGKALAPSPASPRTSRRSP